MLIGQHSGGHQDGHLLVVGTGLESSTYSHLRLAEPHIAAHETIHRSRTFHIGLDIERGLQLVGSILVEEAGLEFVLHEAVGTESETLLLHSAAV